MSFPLLLHKVQAQPASQALVGYLVLWDTHSVEPIQLDALRGNDYTDSYSRLYIERKLKKIVIFYEPAIETSAKLTLVFFHNFS